MLLVSGGQGKYYYGYPPYGPKYISADSGYGGGTFTTRDLGIPDGTVIEFIDEDLTDPRNFTLVAPLYFEHFFDMWTEGNNMRYWDESAWVYEINNPDDKYFYFLTDLKGDTLTSCKMRYSY